MATREYAVRLSIDRANEARTALRGVGQEGDDAFRKIGDRADRAGREVADVRVEATRTSGAMRALSGALSAVSGPLLALAGVGAIVALGNQAVEAADKFTSLQSKLKLVVRESENLKQVTEDLALISIRNRSDLEGTVTLYGRLRSARKELNDEQAQKAVETWNKTLVISGSSAVEAASSTLQFSQAMGAGALRGAELNSVLAGNLRGAQLFADTLGITLGQLKKFGEEGKINTSVMLKGLTGDVSTIDAELAQMGVTVQQAKTNLSTALTVAVGRFNEATGATNAMAGAINMLADSVFNLSGQFDTMFGDPLQNQIKSAEASLVRLEKIDAVRAGDFWETPLFGDPKKYEQRLVASFEVQQKLLLKLRREQAAAMDPAAGAGAPNNGDLAAQAAVIDMWAKIVADAATPVEKARIALKAFNDEAAKLPKDVAAQAGPARAVLVKTLKDAEEAAKKAAAATKEESAAVKEATAVQQKWASIVAASLTPAEKLRAQLGELDDEYLNGYGSLSEYNAAVGALTASIAEAERTAAEATPQFQAVLKIREDLKKAAEDALSPAQKLAAEQTRLNNLIGVDGFTADEAARRLALYGKELGAATEQTTLAGHAQEFYNGAVNSSIDSLEDLEDVALRVLSQIAQQVLETGQAMKATSFSDWAAAFSSVVFGGGRTETGGMGASAAAAVRASVRHSGGEIGAAGAPSRVVSLHAFRTARRHHTGMWPGMQSGERAIIAQDGERMFSRMDNARIVRAVERGGDGPMKVDIHNYAGADVSVKETRSADGGRSLLVMIDKRIRDKVEGDYGMRRSVRGG